MKKIIALIIVCTMVMSLLAACGPKAALPMEGETKGTNEAENNATPMEKVTEEEAQRNLVNYKGISLRTATLEDFAAAEGRAPDFSFDVGDTTIYAYNDVTLGDLAVSQVQISFGEDNIRISCTYTADSGLEEMLNQWKAALDAQYGEAIGEGTYTWRAEGQNYASLTMLNEETIQLAYYLYEE